jgi:hypothetical protein
MNHLSNLVINLAELTAGDLLAVEGYLGIVNHGKWRNCLTAIYLQSAFPQTQTIACSALNRFEPE